MLRPMQLDLKEYESSEPLPLSPVQLNALQDAELDLRISVSPARDKPEGHYVLRPSSIVGAVETDGLSALIEPKIGIPQLLSLACYAVGKVRPQANEFDFPEARALPDFLALALTREAQKAFSRGLLHGYRTEEEALLTVRGRIRFDEQLRRRPGLPLPIETRYDEFTDDILANQLVKAAARRLLRAGVRSAKARQGVGRVAAMLDGVSLREWLPNGVPDVTFTRLNEHYRNVTALSRLVLRRGEFESRRGAVRASGFLMDMNEVFQEFVTVALREKLRLSETAFGDTFGEMSIGSLDEEGAARLRPDLVWRESGRCVFVGDAKYKNVTGDRIPNADLYQLLAYASALDLPGGLLVYAQGEADDHEYTVRHTGKRLRVAALDLSGDIEAVLNRVGSLADKARALRREAQQAAA